MDVPSGYVVANGGELQGRETRGEREVWTYRSRVASWRMDFAIATYGQLEFEGISVFYLPGDSLGAVRLVRAAREAHRRYSDWFGALERSVALTIIEVPDGFGSQKDATTILQTASAFRDSSQLRQMYHEVAHGWTPLAPGLSPRVEEGLATFLEYRLADEIDGADHRAAALARTMADLHEWFEARPEFATVPMASYGERGWSSLSYSVGFLMYAVLYEVVGRERFDRFVGAYYRCCHESGAGTERLGREIERAGGPVAHEIARDWLWSTNWWPMVRDGWSFERIVAHYEENSSTSGGD
ncbi:MAG TPA: hypothetical protein ENO23_04140 [Alphaproteobacteria bacterium]|nr:hypothetical protein [Alphaproteobacteria bacterium]